MFTQTIKLFLVQLEYSFEDMTTDNDKMNVDTTSVINTNEGADLVVVNAYVEAFQCHVW